MPAFKNLFAFLIFVGFFSTSIVLSYKHLALSVNDAKNAWSSSQQTTAKKEVNVLPAATANVETVPSQAPVSLPSIQEYLTELNKIVLDDVSGTIYIKSGDKNLGRKSQRLGSIFAKNFTLDKNGNLTLDGELKVKDKTTLEDNLVVKDDAVFENDVTFKDDVDIDDTLEVDGDTTLRENLTVYEDAIFNDDVSVTGTFTLTGNLLPGADNSYDVGSSTYKWRDGYFGRDLSVDDDLTVSDSLNVTGSTALTGSLAVNTDDLYVNTSNGRVGIGTTGPLVALHLVSSGSDMVHVEGTGSYPTLQIYNKNNSTNLTSGTAVGDFNFAGYFNSTYNPVAQEIARIQGIYTGNGTTRTGDLSFQTGNSGGPAERVRITSAGNLGIGTTGPSQKLQVAGTALATTLSDGTATLSSGTLDLGTNTIYDTNLTGSWGFNSGNLSGIGDIDASTGTITTLDGTSLTYSSGSMGNISISGNTISATNDSGVYLYDNASNGIFVKDGGNVGIGTTSPGAQFTIAGPADTWSHFGVGNNDTVPWLSTLNNAIVNSATYGWQFIYRNTDGDLALYRNENSTSENLVMAWERTTGNVGIGTTGPASMLDISSTAPTLRLTDTTASAKSLLIDTDGNRAQFRATDGAANSLITLDLGQTRIGFGTDPDAFFDVGSSSRYFQITSAIAPTPTFRYDDNSDTYLTLENRNGGSGFGYGVLFNLGDGTNAINAARILAEPEQTWTSTTTTQDSRLTLSTVLDGTLTEYIRVTSTGNVGIGTTGPGTKLDVNGVIYATALDPSGNNGNYGFGYDDFQAKVAGYNGVKLQYWGNGLTTGFTMNNSGNVGIGTTSPLRKLQISGGGILLDNDQRLAWLETDGSTVRPGIYLNTNNNLTLRTGSGNIFAFYKSDLSVLGMTLDVTTSGDSKLGVNGGTSVGSGYYTLAPPSNGMIIEGNVGIGTTDPGSYKLNVAGTGYYGAAWAANFQPVLVLVNPVADADGAGATLQFKNQTSGANYLGGIGARFRGGVASSNIDLDLFAGGDSVTPKVTIEGSGNVGIGTTESESLLEVNGGTAMTGGWIRNTTLTALYPVLALHSTAGSKWAGIGYDAGGTMRIWTNASSNDVSAGTLAMTFSNTGQATVGSTWTPSKFNVYGNVTIGSTYVGDNYAAPTNGLIIEGNVGIGTTNPGTTLQVLNDNGFEQLGAGFVKVWYGNTESTARVEINQNVPGGTGGPNGAGIVFSGGNGIANNGSGIGWPDVYSYKTLAFWTSDGTKLTERMRINGDGNVGIGTTNPSYKLDIVSTSNIYSRIKNTASGGQAGLFIENGDQQWLTYINASGNYVITDQTATPTYPLVIEPDASSNSLYLKSGGNVGIGTTGPTNKLHIYGTGTQGVGLQSSNNGQVQYSLTTGSTSWTMFIPGGGTDLLFWDTQERARITSTGIVLQADTDSYWSLPSNDTFAWTTGGTERVRITETGNVGIGSSTPNALLTVNPTTSIDSFRINSTDGMSIMKTNFRYTSIGYGSSPISGVALSVVDSGSATEQLRITNSSYGTSKVLVVRGAADQSANLTEWQNASGTPLTVVNSSGNVGIGTTTPQRKLHVLDGTNPYIRVGGDNTYSVDIYGGTSSTDAKINTVAGVGLYLGPGNFTTLLSLRETGTVGRVGIGYASPANELDVNGAVAVGASYVGIAAPSNGMIIQGNVGIGTTGPGAKLGFAAATTAAGGIDFGGDVNLYRVTANNLQTDDRFLADQISASNGYQIGGTTIITGGGGLTPVQSLIFTGIINPDITTTANNDLEIAPNGAGNVLITSGNVGIGTTGPTAKLNVIGDTTIYSTVQYAPNVIFQSHSDNTSGANLQFVKTGRAAGVAGDNIGQLLSYGQNSAGTTGKNYSQINFLIGSPSAGAEAGRMDFVNAVSGTGTTVMTINSGNVGIGTTGPGKPLEVIDPNGSGAIRLSRTGQPSYDFALSAALANQTDLKFLPSANSSGYWFVSKNDSGTSGNFVMGKNGGIAIGDDNFLVQPPTNGAIIQGNVGIGTTNPGAKLDVNGNIQIPDGSLFRSTSASAFLQFGSGYARLNAPSGGVMGFYPNNTKVLQLGGNGGLSFGTSYSATDPGTNIAIFEGNVGIGTTGPGSKLQIQAAGGSASGLSLTTSAGGFFEVFPSSNVANPTWNLLSNSGEAINLGVSVAGTGISIDTSGNVGIGTTGPNAKLEVNADAANVRIVTNTSGAQFGIYENASERLALGYSPTSDYIYLYSGAAGKDMLRALDGGNLSLQPVSGNVGIGTTSPGTKLSVAGLTGTASYNLVRVDTTTGDFYYDSSSERYKNNIETYDAEFSKILNIDPKSFTDKASGNYEIGFIAEEFDEAGLTDLVIYKEGTPDALKYDKIPIYLLGVIKNQQKEIELLKQRFDLELFEDPEESTESSESTPSEKEDLAITIDTLEVQKTLRVLENLNVLGAATLANTNIAGVLTVGLIEIDDLNNSINTVETLKIQNKSIADVEFFDGSITLSKSGEVSAVVLKAERVEADRGLFKEILITDNKTAGSGTIKSEETQTTVETEKVKSSSRIFTSLRSKPGGRSLVVTDVEEGVSFKVEVEEAYDEDIEFDWWVVNSE